MSEILFCNKCGNRRTTDINKSGEKCAVCGEGVYINSGVDFGKAINEIDEDYQKKHKGNYPSRNETEELLRKKYYYGKLDQQTSYSAVSQRKYSESPEAREEANRHWRAQERDKRENSFGPKCPSCGSTNLSKITATRKILKVGLFGRLGTGDLGKTYQCNDCGIKF